MVYDKLLRLPLFTGMSLDELKNIIGKTKMDFDKKAEGMVIVRRGEKSGRMLIILDGEVESVAEADDGSYSLAETLHAPFIIQPEVIFGRFQEFTRTVRTTSPVSTVTIDKGDILTLVSRSLIFRLNMLGIMSTAIQRSRQELWRNNGRDLQQRLISFFRMRCITPVGHKVFKVKMTTLAGILNVSRLEVSHALNAMRARGVIVLSRGKVDIPDLHALL